MFNKLAKLLLNKQKIGAIEQLSPKMQSTENPYGVDIKYADTGYQKDRKKRYPIDTVEHIRAAWNYIHKPNNRKPYTDFQLTKIENRIIAAWKKKINKAGPPSVAKK